MTAVALDRHLRGGPFVRPRVFTHGLARSGFAEDGALAELLDRCPADLFDVNLYSYDDEGRVSLRTGTRGSLPGAELLDAVKRGRLWINIREAERACPELWAAAEAEVADVVRTLPGFAPVKLSGQLIISAPQAKVPYHADPAGVFLFHLRGRKRVWVYPADAAHAPDRSMEAVVLRRTTEELPYHREMDLSAEIFDLAPGQMLTWPVHAPHRVENLDEFCVSLSLDWQTWGTRLTNGALAANGVLRDAGVKPGAIDATPMAARAALWVLGAGVRRLGLVKSRLGEFERTFEAGREEPWPNGVRNSAV